MIKSYRRSHSILAAELNDPNGIVTSFATTAAEDVRDGAELNGVMISGGTIVGLPRTVTISRSAAVATYTVTDIVILGTRGGAEVTESITPPDADGGDVLRGSQVFDVITSITFPAQVDGAGLFEVGVGDVGTVDAADRFAAVELHLAGSLNVEYSPTQTDTIPLPASVVRTIAPTKILTDPLLTTPTSVGLTVYTA